MSPYIVITKRPVDAVDCGHPEAPRDGWPVSRRAVATLEEARQLVAAKLPTDANIFDLGSPESGGTVGPLPDGTVIEVEQVGWLALTSDGQMGSHRDFDWPAQRARVIDAFNARESS